MSDDVVVEKPWWAEHEYLQGKEVGGGLWMCVNRMLYTWRVMLCTKEWVHDYYCYKDLADALLAFESWDGKGENPVDGWTRRGVG